MTLSLSQVRNSHLSIPFSRQEHGANWIATDHPLDRVHSVQDHGQQAPLNQLQIQRTLQCSLNLLKQITFTPARMNWPRRSRGKGFSQARSILTIQEPKEFEKQIRRWHLYCPKVSYVSRHRPLWTKDTTNHVVPTEGLFSLLVISHQFEFFWYQVFPLAKIVCVSNKNYRTSFIDFRQKMEIFPEVAPFLMASFSTCYNIFY